MFTDKDWVFPSGTLSSKHDASFCHDGHIVSNNSSKAAATLPAAIATCAHRHLVHSHPRVDMWANPSLLHLLLQSLLLLLLLLKLLLLWVAMTHAGEL